jgi:hypothetical protein
MQITSDPVWSSNVQEEVKTFVSTHTLSPSLSGDDCNIWADVLPHCCVWL